MAERYPTGATLPSVIIEGGTIYTADPALPQVRGLPIDDRGRVTRGVEAWEGDTSKVSNERIDLGGRTVVPGFVDAHLHFLSWALDRLRVDVRDAPTAAAALELIAAQAAADRTAGTDSTWLIAAGWTALDTFEMVGAEPHATDGSLRLRRFAPGLPATAF